jgi:hypothetical protein
MNYRGTAQADNSDQMTMTGYGLTGDIEGMRMECALTRAAGPVFDPTIPYEGTGTIKPAPLVVTTLIDESQAASWPQKDIVAGATLYPTNQQLTIVTPYPGSWFSPVRSASVAPGHTLEARIDLVQLSDAGLAMLALYYADGHGYWLDKAGDHISIGKQVAGQGLANAFFSCEPVVTGNANRILALAITPSGENVIITARVLDKANQAVLYEKSVVDTPAADPTLTGDQVAAVYGATWFTVTTDRVNPPWKTFKSPWFGAFALTQGTSVEATFDNFQMRDYEIPPLGISHAVQLSWTCPAGANYSVESAPTALGPWVPVNAQPGIQQLSFPATKDGEFFRLQRAP